MSKVCNIDKLRGDSVEKARCDGGWRYCCSQSSDTEGEDEQNLCPIVATVNKRGRRSTL